MAFPPEFSSTLSYANRYDLDEIDVFLEGDSSNPMFFSPDGLPKYLSFGKHYFYISILDSSKLNYELRPKSRILFEFKSINNVILRSDVVELNQRNGVANCFVEVLKDPLRTFKEIEDGQGTLTMVGSLQNKASTVDENLIPEKFIGAMNYRCVFPINIAKNILNATTNIVLQSSHKTSTLAGQFSFAKAVISPIKQSTRGLLYDANGKPSVDLFPSITKGQQVRSGTS